MRPTLRRQTIVEPMPALLLCALGATACGRFGFDAVCADGTDGTCEPPADAVSPSIDAPLPIDDRLRDPDGDGQPELVALYLLDGGSPNDSAGAHHGSVVGTVSADVDRDGLADAACRFFDNAFVEVPSFSELSTPQFSVSAWARVEWASIVEFGSIVTWRDDNPIAGYSLYVRNVSPTGRWEIYLAPSPANPTGNPWNSTLHDAAQDDAWHHMVMTYDGQAMALYLDGVLVSSASSNYNHLHTRPMRIAMGATESDGTYPFTGIVDEVALYNRALSEQEILAIYTR